MHVIHCTENNNEYNLTIQAGCISDGSIVSACQNLANHFIIISDPNICQQYAEPIYQQCLQKNIACTLISLPGGEQHKTRETKQQIEDQLLELGCGRDTAIIAVGGGVTTDLAGFIAATYCRGIPSIYVPTTLLAMVDASIGGKTAVNTAYGKNLIGAFHSPSHVFCDPTTLNTLSDDQLLDGLAESIKHALIKDALLFGELASLTASTDISAITSEQWENIIYKSCLIKRDTVVEDALENKGPRQLLNFGHTVAHSIEKLTGYQYSHGQAVMIGIYIESYFSFLSNQLSQEEFEKIHNIIMNLSYKNRIELTDKNIESLIKNMSLDKKSINKSPRFVLLEKIGQAFIKEKKHSHELSREKIDKGLRHWIMEIQK